jgi:ABC-type Mn2+/Zn2+ transport system permease subunit
VSNSNDLPSPGLKPPQFSLRTLLLVIALLGLFFAWVPYIPATASFLIVMAVLTVFAHLAGAHIGSQLKAGAPRARVSPANDRLLVPRVEKMHFAKTTELSQRKSLGWPLLVCVAIGLLGGGAGGALLARIIYPEMAGWAHIVLAGVTFAGLGGMVAFLVGGFLQTSLSGLLEATRPVETPVSKKTPIGAPKSRDAG